MTTTAPKYILHDKKLLRQVQNDLYEGYEEVPETEIKIVEQEPRFRWLGAKIPLTLWLQVCEFMRWTQEKYKEEAMIFFFYNVAKKEWAAWPFPQSPNGMTVRMLENHPMYKTDRLQFGNDWVQAGTLHHHCTATAFQSGTDRSDEEDRDGIHFTLGNMDKHSLDLHCRQVFDGIMSSARPLDWIEMPAFLNDVPRNMRYEFAIHTFKTMRHEGKTPAFPEEWKDRIIKIVPTSQMEWDSEYGGFRMGQHTETGTATKNDTPAAGKVGGGHIIHAGEFKAMQTERIKLILKTLAISAPNAFRLLTTSTAVMTAEDRMMKGELSKALNKVNCPTLYAEDVLQEMAQEDLEDIRASGI